ncbi:MAG: hypothetical protein CMG27_03275 [Candidatus Marinimicrobia bacterium]|nr:hypothetical protein [Candidatus Neomarinimicrobiota bacterium]
MKRLLTLFIIFSAVVSAQVKVVASVDKKKINLNQHISFEVKAEGSEEFPQVDLSPIKDFTIASGPSQSSSYQMFNNKVTTAYSLSWNLLPKKKGKLTIPSLKVVVDRKSYITKPITIQVSKSSRSRSKQTQQPESETQYIFLEAYTDKREAFIGEQITVEFMLYTQVNINDLSISQKPQGIGFWKEELQSPRSPKFRLRERDGVRYNVASLGKIALFSTETGQLILDPMILDVTVSSRSVNRFPTFDDLRFGDPFSIFPQSERFRLESEPVELTIHPLPEEGRPENYSQAVGQFSLSTYIDSSEVEVNRAVTFKVELKGTGNLNLVEINEPDFPGGVEIFDRKRPMFDRDVFRDDFTGVKLWEYIIMPRRSGLFIVPEMELAYFNPAENSWEVIRSKPLRLNVEPGRGTSSGSGSSQDVFQLDQDIRYIRTSPVQFRLIRQEMIPSLVWWLAGIGALLFIFPGAVLLVQGDSESRRLEGKSRTALRRSRRKLKRITSVDDYTTVSKVITVYIADKFGLPSAGLDVDTINSLLTGIVSDEKRKELGEILTVCNEGRFSPGEAQKSAVELAGTIKEILTSLEEEL